MRRSDTYTSTKMKYSAFIGTRPKKQRTVRDSELASFNTHSVSRRQKDRPSPSPQSTTLPLGTSCSSKMAARKATFPPGNNDKQSQNAGISSIMHQLKKNYPRFSDQNKLKRTTSMQMLCRTNLNFGSKQCQPSIKEIQQKKTRQEEKGKIKSTVSPIKTLPSQQINVQRIDAATQKCKQLCQDLKRTLLKETVSTTTTQSAEQQLSIKQFSLGKLLGKGKFSRVYLARHKRSGMIFALKIITKDTIRRQKFQDQLAREIIIQTYFNHVNLVRLYAFFADQTNVYLILQYCPGGQLYDIFKLKSKLKDEEWVPIMKGICEGLLVLHLSNVIHRDLKPENVMLAFGLPKIADFGWAVYSPDDRRETFCGTPLYISPELILGGSYNKQVDIWALGVMMYEFLTGKIPFRICHNSNLSQLITSKIDYPKTLSKNSQNLMKMILNKDPMKRIAIMDILDHPYISNFLTTILSPNTSFKSGR